jgi:PAS domain S-box-containing protein
MSRAVQRSGTATAPRPPRARAPQRAASQHFRELFENANDIILINDRQGRIVAANRAAREFGGYTLAEVERGVSLRDVLPAHEFEAAMIVTQRALDGLPIPEMYEREVMLRDGGRRFVELRSNVLRRRGRPWALQTIGRDVTEKKNAAALQASLLTVSQALLTAQSLDELGRVICEEASRVLQVDGAYLWLRRGDELVGCAAAGLLAHEFTGERRSLSDSVVGQIYRAADVLVINDVQHSLYAGELARESGVQAMLAVPLRRSGPPVGVLIFTDSQNPRRFTRTVHDQAVIFGAQTTVAIESALAREREEEERLVSVALLRVTRDIRESLEEAAVLPQIAHSAREVLLCDWTAVALWDAVRGGFRVTMTEGWSAAAAEELQLLDLRPGSLTAIDTLVAHQTLEVTEPRGRVELYRRWGISSFLAVPMLRGGRVVGALVAGFHERCGPFSTRERRIAEGIAAQAAVAVENARLVEDLRRANRLKSEFLGTMSHELRTPLSAILGYAELLHEGVMGQLDAEQHRAIERVLVNGRGLLELINITLDVNRLEAGRTAVEVSEFSLDELFAELRSEYAARPATDAVPLVWPEACTPVQLCTDRGKLKVVIRNLVDNALKFTAHGSVTVRVRYNADLERLRVSVRDTGVGIPPEALTTIFEMFRQLDGTRGSSRGGVGLGLYLVRRYTELLGGEVTVESVPGEGSTFVIDIPVRIEERSA